MKVTNITSKLQQLDCPVSSLLLGDFDAIGEYTAKKARGRENNQYATTGCFFRPNYERGMLITAMVKRYKPQRVLEIGFGRGYWTTCCARAMYDAGIEGEVISIDPHFDNAHVDMMSKLFPHEWLNLVKMTQGRSVDVLPKIEGDFDIIYIDGDHSYQAVKSDWLAIKDRFKQFVVFDDYHMQGKIDEQNEIQVARAVDEIDAKYERELIVMDREIFCDDRPEYRAGQQKYYGQVIVKHPDFEPNINEYAHDW